MYRQYARSKREKRVNIRISSKRYSQIGLVAAHCESEFVFPYIYDETMRASVFENWFEDELLKEFSSWITRHFIRKRSYRTLRKNNRGHWFFCRRILRSTILLNTRGALCSRKLQGVFIDMDPFYRFWMPFFKASSCSINVVGGDFRQFCPAEKWRVMFEYLVIRIKLLWGRDCLSEPRKLLYVGLLSLSQCSKRKS